MAIGEDKQQVVVILPKYIVKMIDEDAEKEIRKRGPQIAKILIDHYTQKEKDKNV